MTKIINSASMVGSSSRFVQQVTAWHVLFAISFIFAVPAWSENAEAKDETNKIGASQLAYTKSSPLISLQFKQASVAEVLNMISEQSGLSIIISSDVSGTLPRIALNDITPELAIKYIAQAADLQVKKTDAKTYIVTKKTLTTVTGSSSRFDENTPENGGGSDFTLEDELTIAPKPKTANTAPLTGLGAVQLTNVRPSLMAYWLDPAHQPVPEEIKTSKRATDFNATIGKPQAMEIPAPPSPFTGSGANGGYSPYNSTSPQFSQGGSGGTGGTGTNTGFVAASPTAGGTLSLPEGVDNLIAVDAQNVLLVRGTDEGVDRLREIVALLDRPITQVEIEAQFVTVNVTDLDSLGIDFSRNTLGQVGFGISGSAVGDTNDSLANATVAVTYTGDNFAASLNALRRQQRVKTISAPRVTTFNNMTAQLSNSFTQFFILTNTVLVPGPNGTFVTQTTQQVISINTGIGLTVLPTVLRDGTITINLQPFVATPGGIPTASQPLPNLTIQNIATAANIKDGDTLAIGGLRTTVIDRNDSRIPILSKIPIIGSLFRNKTNNQSETETIIFLTARVVRRIDEPVPGT